MQECRKSSPESICRSGLPGFLIVATGTTMRRRILGRTGIEVSELGFGSLFTSSLGPGFETSRRAVHRAIELGINYFDTAPAYANSEEVLGRILAEIDAPLVVSTKLGGRPQPFDPQNQTVRATPSSREPAAATPRSHRHSVHPRARSAAAVQLVDRSATRWTARSSRCWTT